MLAASLLASKSDQRPLELTSKRVQNGVGLLTQRVGLYLRFKNRVAPSQTDEGPQRRSIFYRTVWILHHVPSKIKFLPSAKKFWLRCGDGGWRPDRGLVYVALKNLSELSMSY